MLPAARPVACAVGPPGPLRCRPAQSSGATCQPQTSSIACQPRTSSIACQPRFPRCHAAYPCGPGCLMCPWAAARPVACAASCARRVASKPGQAPPPPTGTAARPSNHSWVPQPHPTIAHRHPARPSHHPGEPQPHPATIHGLRATFVPGSHTRCGESWQRQRPRDEAPVHETNNTTVDTSPLKPETTGTSICASLPRDATVGTTVDAPQHQIETTAATVNDVRPFLGCFSPIEVPPVSYRRFKAPTEAPRVSFNRPQLLAKVSSVPPRTREFHCGPNSSTTGPRNLRADTCSFTTKCAKRPT